MTPEDEVLLNEGASVLVRLRESLPDAVGLIGFGLLARGLWVGFGEAVSLSVCGVILMALSIYAIRRGGS
ncbi:hypothetical protein KC131_26215 [Pseudomonas sp. JQ170]|uniref:hypothetical protein n=1 Tax=unclassified Pseudomonas TaxID=196821 RepID=UPI0026563C4D|nr:MULTISPECIES: hypothetical protein [unclassified Pseudomonas]MDN7144146.1 hypothetical protein [Pseudomonas sp. JQ170]WRO77745.1 hypothetical protein U9R80_08725 [Pseudomonas sp. 170C]